MSFLAMVYIGAAIVSIIVGFLLVQLAMQSGAAKLDLEKKKSKQPYMAPGADSDKPLQEKLDEEISTLVDSQQRTKEISSRLMYHLDRELEKRVQNIDRELSRKYESTLKEKISEQEVVWQKYSTVLAEKKETEAVIRSISDGLVVVDAEGKVIMMNPAAEKLLGASSKEKSGSSILDNVREEQLISLVKGSSDGKNKEMEIASANDETKKTLRASSAVIENEKGQPVGMVSVLSDITKQKELDRMKSNFVASVSHELRTPLVAIDKSVDLMLTKTPGPLTQNQEEFLVIAERNLKRLQRLIDDLLDLSKIEAGKMELKPQPTSLAILISECVSSLENWAKTRAVKFEMKVQPDLPQVNLDPDRITQVLTNLMSNAIKFMPAEGLITVVASLEKDMLEVYISDTGIGIPKENLAKLFSKFYQVNPKINSGISGTGIGLSIAKEIVELHGGKIWVDSQERKGTKFTFSLPLKPDIIRKDI